MSLTRFGIGLCAMGALALVGFGCQKPAASNDKMELVGRYDPGLRGEEGVLEIGAYHAASQRVFLTSYDKALWVVDLSDPATPQKINKIELGKWGKGATSVSTNGDMVAVAVVGKTKQHDGYVLIYNADGELQKEFKVGALPDMVKISPDGKKIVVACEGEPDDSYEFDPVGQVWVIDIANGLNNSVSYALDFSNFTEANLNGARIAGKNASVAQDIEPEYIDITSDSSTAFVGLQENNAVAKVDLDKKRIVAVMGLGYKDHSKEGNGLDASNKDDAINIKTWPVRGLYQPDAIAILETGGKTYFLTANEGDSREYGDEDNGPFWTDESRIGKVKLDPKAFPNAEELQKKENLGRLKLLTTEGDTDGDGDFDELYVMGARSFSIWTEDGKQVYDSGDFFEQETAKRFPKYFNSAEDESAFDDRSDDKGPEPEGVVVGKVGDKTYAFICLERVGGVMMYDVTDPTSPKFVEYVNNRNFEGNYDDGTALDFSPEGLVFISAADSPSGEALLLVIHEMSGTMAIYQIK